MNEDTYFVGQVVPLRFLVTDADGEPATPTSYSLTVRLPVDGSTPVALVPDNPAVGDYRADYFPGIPGRYVATFATSGLNADAIEDAFDVQPEAAGVVTLASLREYLGDGSTLWTDAELGSALAAESASQARRCRLDPSALDLAEALRRRVARNLAMRKLPLGLTAAASDIETTRIGATDPEIRRLEGPWRRVVVG